MYPFMGLSKGTGYAVDIVDAFIRGFNAHFVTTIAAFQAVLACLPADTVGYSTTSHSSEQFANSLLMLEWRYRHNATCRRSNVPLDIATDDMYQGYSRTQACSS